MPTTDTTGNRIVPYVRDLARRLGVDVDQITGSAAGGRVLAADVRAAARAAAAQAVARVRAEGPDAPEPTGWFPGGSPATAPASGPRAASDDWFPGAPSAEHERLTSPEAQPTTTQ